MIIADVRACDEEDARSLLRWAGGDVPADLGRKGRDGGILANKALADSGDEFAQDLVIREGAGWHEVSLSGEG
jgi:hypothetical protein